VLFLAGKEGSGGHRLADSQTPEVIVVTTADNTRYAIIGHRRHLIRDPDVVLPGLVWTRQATQVATALVNVIPAGVDLTRLATKIPGFGTAVGKPAGGKIGQVYVVARSGGGEDYFVAMSTGLASLTQFQKDLLLTDPMTGSKIGATEATKLSAKDFTPLGQNIQPFQGTDGDGALPAATPALTEVPSGAVCTTVKSSDGVSEVRMGVTVADTAGVVTGTRDTTGAVLADRVVIGPGQGVIVSASVSSGAGVTALSLVTDLGIRYAIPGEDVLSMLGYSGGPTIHLPAEVLALLPQGPALDPDAARTPS
jgi:hypothetical protein